MRRDRARMTDAERALIRDAVRECPLRRIVIVHGTDTLEITGERIVALLGTPRVPIRNNFV